MNKFLDGIKKLMFAEQEVAPKANPEVKKETEPTDSEPKNFKDVKSKDGLILKITEDIVVGAKVEVINEDGTLTLPTEGEIILEDGTMLKVDAEGIILEIIPAEAKQEEPAPAPVEEMSEIEQLKETVKFMAEEFNKIKAEKQIVESTKEEKETEIIKLNKTISDLISENKELSKQPAVKVKSNFKKIEEGEQVKYSSLSKLLEKNKPNK